MSNQTFSPDQMPQADPQRPANKIVLSIEPAATSDVRAMDAHERLRKPDGTSAIDPERRHLNQTLHGPIEGPMASLTALFDGGVGRPAKQAEAPYLRIVISASPAYFRPDSPDAHGTWDEERLGDWVALASAWLKETFGEDCLHIALHLDEDTPHIHALVAPTYERKPRVPGTRCKGETAEAFDARRNLALTAAGVRTAGRASHPVLRKRGSFKQLRHELTRQLAPLGLVYGDDRTPQAPAGISGREFVRRETVRLRQAEAEIDRSREEIRKREADLEARQAAMAERELTLKQDHDGLVRDRDALVADRTAHQDRLTQWDMERAKLQQQLGKASRIFQEETARQQALCRTLDDRQAALDELLAAVADQFGVSPEIEAVRKRLEELSQDIDQLEELDGPGF